MIRLLELLLFIPFYPNAQKANFEQIAVDYFFDSIFAKNYSEVKRIEFNAFTSKKLSSFSFFRGCFDNKDTIGKLLAISSNEVESKPKQIRLDKISKIRFTKERSKGRNGIIMSVYLANSINDCIYVRIDMYKKLNTTDSYMFELNSEGNIIRWCKTGVIW